MTGQLGEIEPGRPFVPLVSRPRPIVVAHHAPLRMPGPRRDVVDRAFPSEINGEGIGVLSVPFGWDSGAHGSLEASAAYSEDRTVAAVQCDVCGSPVGRVDKRPEDGGNELIPLESGPVLPRWLRVGPCEHSSADAPDGLFTMLMDITAPEAVTDWLYCWASFYGRPRPDPVDPDDSPPALFDSDGTVLEVWR